VRRLRHDVRVWVRAAFGSTAGSFEGAGERSFSRQQPDGGDAADTPGVAAAPVALAGAIVLGVAKFIVMLSAQAGVFGVGTTAICGSMLVPTA
jgi:hypothetical protein